MNSTAKNSVRLLRWIVPAALSMAASAAAAAVHLALVPSTANVSPGAEFEIRLEITQAAEPFNAYDATINYDPAALTFVQKSPLGLQEGSLMVNACSNRFHVFHASPLTINHALICPDVQLTGPGTLYTLRFRASSTAQRTQVSLAAPEFYLLGSSVPLSAVAPLTVTIGTPSDTPPPAGVSSAPHLRAWPNPFNPATTISVETAAAGSQRLAVYDARGRLVRVLQTGSFAPGTRTVPFDGRDQTGSTLSAGGYTVVLQADGAKAVHRLVLLK